MANRSELRTSNEIRTRPCPQCYLCGSEGEPLYRSLEDRLFGSEGEWTLKECFNPECGLVWLDPMPLQEDIGKAYKYYYTHGEEEQSLLSLAKPSRLRKAINAIFPLRQLRRFARNGFLASAYGYTDGVSRLQRLAGQGLYLYPFPARILARTIGYVHYLPHGRLLDVGCGDGLYLEYMQRLGWEVEGVEVDPRSSELARQRGLVVYSGVLEQRRFEDCRFDVIVLSHLLEHLHDPAALLQECYRILKPGGIIKVFVPNLESMGHAWFKESWLGLDPPRHIHLFTLRALRKLALEAGFNVKLGTSSAMARSIYKISASLAAGSIPRNEAGRLLLAFKAYLFDVYESFSLLFNQGCGEEIVLEGQKKSLTSSS